MSKLKKNKTILIIMVIVLIASNIYYFKGNKTTEVADETTDATETEKYDFAEMSKAIQGVLEIKLVTPDFFTTAKLERVKTRKLNKENSMEIIHNTKMTEDDKETAFTGFINLPVMAVKEDVIEMQLQLYGFSDALVSIIDDQVTVIINADNVTPKNITKAQDIVKKNIRVKSKDIIISAVTMED